MFDALLNDSCDVVRPTTDPRGDLRERFVGLDREVPLFGGARRVYTNLDNAATTPPLREVLETVNRFMEWYASIHRGTGYKSLLSTELYDRSRAIVSDFCGADPKRHIVIYCGNTTQAINILARRLGPGGVLTTLMEHHSNMLPWRVAGPVDYAAIHAADGSLDLDSMERTLRAGEGRIRLVTVTGASNVTGVLNPLRKLARLAHAHGAMLMVDAAQLAGHHPIKMGTPGEAESIDFLAFSAHKLYAPFGAGVLVARRDAFEAGGPPANPGGGTVRMVTLDDIAWDAAPELEEGGTPNVTGAVALAKALRVLDGLGMDKVAAREGRLTRHLMARLREIPGLRIHGPADPDNGHPRIGVVSFTLESCNHALVAAALGYEWGIGVRNGCFCAQPYLWRLLGLDPELQQRNLAQARAGDMRGFPGFVRVSLGLYNTTEEIDYLVEALRSIAAKGPRGRYHLEPTGQYLPDNYTPDLLTESFF